MIGWIIFAIVATCVLLYCKFGKSVGHIPDFRKPFSVVALIVYAIIMIVCCSCRSVQYVPVETVRTETQYKDRLQRDSIHVLDSVFMLVKGDTVFRDHYRVVYRDKLIRDTTFIHKVDSVNVPFPVEKRLTKWQSIKMNFGGFALCFIVAFALVVVGWLVYRWRKNLRGNLLSHQIGVQKLN